MERRGSLNDRSSSTPEDVRLHARQHDICPRDPEMQTVSRAARGPDPVAGLLLYENNGTRFINPGHWQAIMNNAVSSTCILLNIPLIEA